MERGALKHKVWFGIVIVLLILSIASLPLSLGDTKTLAIHVVWIGIYAGLAYWLWNIRLPYTWQAVPLKEGLSTDEPAL